LSTRRARSGAFVFSGGAFSGEAASARRITLDVVVFRTLCTLAFVAASLAAHLSAGEALPAPVQSAAGSEADWDMRPHIEKIGRNLAMLKPILDKIQPERWNVEGGPAAYQKQAKACTDGLGYVQNALARWSAQPDRLSLMLETVARIESLSRQALSLSLGVERYQNPAIGELLEAQVSVVASDLEWLRAQSLDLAVQREKELDTAQKEAQRCRTQILQKR
jgi:hypothetical protein